MRWSFGNARQIAWAHALVVLRMVIFGAVLFAVLRPLLTAATEPRTGSAPEMAQHAALAWLALLFVYLFLFKVAGASWRDLGFERRGLERNLVLGVALFAVGLVVIHARALLSGASIAEPWIAAAGYHARQRLVLLFIAIHAVLGEEVLFRGYLQPGLRARLSPPLAVGAAALVFALYHVDLTFAGNTCNFIWGLLWGAARERTGSTIPGSVAHALNWLVLGWY